MGANRKRLADQMEGGEEQPPRIDKKNKSGRKKKDKKRGTKNKDGSEKTSKSNKEGSSSERGTSLETTATAEGKQMAQVLSTFSRLEQSRFEAFRKAAFHGDAIAKYVAHCLIHEQHRPVSAGDITMHAPDIRTRIPGANNGPTDRDGKQKARFRNLRPNPHYQRRLVLSELVAPGQAQDITVVVSTLAKEYAQRLVLAARRHTAERLLVNNEEESEAISPEDLLQAFSDRQARGLDPGFFLGGTKTKNATASETSLFLADPESHQRYSLSRSVALAAQDEYDKEQEEEEEEEGEEDNEDDMNIDNDSQENVEKAADKSEEGKLDNEKEDGDDEEEEDPSEQAMRLFSLHVNRIIARQNGITVVTTDDEEEAKREEESKKQGELTKPQITPGQEEKEEGTTISASKQGETKEEETKPSPSTPNQDEPTSATIEEEEGQQKESSTATIENKAEEPSSKEKEDLNDAIEKPSESKELEEFVPVDTTADAQTPTETAEAVETSDGDVAMDTSPDDNTAKEEEKRQEAMPTQPTENTDATPKPPSDTAATSETAKKTEEAVEPPKADATTATEGAPVSAEGETLDATQEQEIIMIDEDD